MALRKATFSITTDSFGYGEDDARITPTATTRPSILRSVEFGTAPGAGNVTLYELNYDDVELEYDIGTQLFYSSGLGDVDRAHPRLETVDADGVAITAEQSGDIYMDVQYVRCTIEGMASSDYTVVATYETAGDYRF